MELLPQLFAKVIHFGYGIFSVALPNIIAIALLIVALFAQPGHDYPVHRDSLSCIRGD